MTHPYGRQGVAALSHLNPLRLVHGGWLRARQGSQPTVARARRLHGNVLDIACRSTVDQLSRRCLSLLRLAIASLLVIATGVGCGAQGPATTTPTPPPELVRQGSLRVAFSQEDANVGVGGEPGGVQAEVARELAKRMGIGLSGTIYPTTDKALDAVRSGLADFAFASPERAGTAGLAASVPVVELNLAYLLAPSAPFQTTAEIDEDGVRVVTLQGGSADVLLSARLRKARLSRVDGGLSAAVAMLRAGSADVWATTVAAAREHQADLPGSRILTDGASWSSLILASSSARSLLDYTDKQARLMSSKAFVTEVATQSGAGGVRSPSSVADNGINLLSVIGGTGILLLASFVLGGIGIRSRARGAL